MLSIVKVSSKNWPSDPEELLLDERCLYFRLERDAGITFSFGGSLAEASSLPFSLGLFCLPLLPFFLVSSIAFLIFSASSATSLGITSFFFETSSLFAVFSSFRSLPGLSLRLLGDSSALKKIKHTTITQGTTSSKNSWIFEIGVLAAAKKMLNLWLATKILINSNSVQIGLAQVISWLHLFIYD